MFVKLEDVIAEIESAKIDEDGFFEKLHNIYLMHIIEQIKKLPEKTSSFDNFKEKFAGVSNEKLYNLIKDAIEDADRDNLLRVIYDFK